MKIEKNKVILANDDSTELELVFEYRYKTDVKLNGKSIGYVNA